jgi:hypothetical protein
MRIFERWYFGLCWNLRLVVELILISWRILVSFRGFFEDYIFANEIFEFPWFFFCIRILFNVNGKATDYDTPLVSLDNELLGSNSGALKFCLGFRVLGFQFWWTWKSDLIPIQFLLMRTSGSDPPKWAYMEHWSIPSPSWVTLPLLIWLTWECTIGNLVRPLFDLRPGYL